jgi:hypothetical protein
MKKTVLIIGGLAAVVAISFIVRSKITPHFSIESQDNIGKKGMFKFGSVVNEFGLGGGKSVAARNGYVCVVTSDKNSVYFKLYKDGKFIADLKQINF